MENNIQHKEKETEVCVYGYISDLEDLSKADRVLTIVQLGATLGSTGRCRCRSTEENAATDYEMTVKTNKKDNSNVSSKYEYNFPVDKNYFDYFKSISQEWQSKKRYIFRVSNIPFITYNEKGECKNIVVPELLYEIDVFEKEENVYSNWCKIDIEIDDALDYIYRNTDGVVRIELNVSLKHLPLVIDRAFMADTTSIEISKKIADLWANEFSRKN